MKTMGVAAQFVSGDITWAKVRTGHFQLLLLFWWGGRSLRLINRHRWDDHRHLTWQIAFLNKYSKLCGRWTTHPYHVRLCWHHVSDVYMSNVRPPAYMIPNLSPCGACSSDQILQPCFLKYVPQDLTEAICLVPGAILPKSLALGDHRWVSLSCRIRARNAVITTTAPHYIA